MKKRIITWVMFILLIIGIIFNNLKKFNALSILYIVIYVIIGYLIINYIYKKRIKKIYEINQSKIEKHESSMIVEDNSENYYQLFITGEKLYFLNVGNFKKGLSLEKLVDPSTIDIDNLDIPYFSYDLKDIKQVYIDLKENVFGFRTLSMVVDGKKKVYNINYYLSLSQLKYVFKGLDITVANEKVDTRSKEYLYENCSDEEKLMYSEAFSWTKIFDLACLFISSLLLFGNSNKMITTNLYIISIFLIISVVVITLLNYKKYELMFIDNDKKRAHILSTFLLSLLIFLLTISDYNYFKEQSGYIILGIICLVISILFSVIYTIIRLKKDKKVKKYFFTTLFYLFITVYSITICLNYNFDYSEPITTNEEVVRLEDSISNNGYYRVYYQEKKYIEVDKKIFSDLKVGDEFLLEKHNGLFGFKYYKLLLK